MFSAVRNGLRTAPRRITRYASRIFDDATDPELVVQLLCFAFRRTMQVVEFFFVIRHNFRPFVLRQPTCLSSDQSWLFRIRFHKLRELIDLFFGTLHVTPAL